MCIRDSVLPMVWYHLLKVLFLHKYPPMLDLLLVAVKPEYQNKGVNADVYKRQSIYCKTNYGFE